MHYGVTNQNVKSYSNLHQLFYIPGIDVAALQVAETESR